MTDRKPLVSIGLPVFNGENHLRQALDSLLAQDYEKFELVISDNASTDATQQICLEYARRDRRIRYHRNEVNLGMVKNFNRVFELSRGRYFMWAAHDDLWEPSFVSHCEEVLRGDRSVVLCYPDPKYIGLDGEPIELPFRSFGTRGMDPISRFHVVIWGRPVFPVYGLIKSNFLKRTRLFTDAFGSDITIQIELSLLGEFAHLPAPLFYRRVPYNSVPGRDVRLEQLDAFLRGINKPVTTKWSALRWYLELVYDHIRAVNTHVHGYRERALFVPSVVFCALIKYRWLLRSFLALSKRNKGKA